MHLPFYITLLRLFRGLWSAFKDPEFKALFLFVIILLITGTLFYTAVEGWRFLDSFYFSFVTLTTVGYGDFAPHTDLGKIFTIVYILVGVGTLLSFITTVARHSQENDPLHKYINEFKLDKETLKNPFRKKD